jgi:hypothetical protein
VFFAKDKRPQHQVSKQKKKQNQYLHISYMGKIPTGLFYPGRSRRAKTIQSITKKTSWWNRTRGNLCALIRQQVFFGERERERERERLETRRATISRTSKSETRKLLQGQRAAQCSLSL